MKLTNISDLKNTLKIIYNEKKINLNNPTILFIEPYGSTLSLLKHGVQKGFNIIILTANSDLRKVPDIHIQASILSLQINTSDTHEVLRAIKEIDKALFIDAVIPGFEYFVPLAASINQYLNLPSIEEKYIKNFRRKDVMRTTLKNAGILMPKFRIVNTMKELDEAIKEIGFPAICKPIDAAGSVNVKKVSNISEAVLAANRILKGNDILWGYKISNSLIYEEYIDGKEFSLEGVVQNNVVSHFSITEKFVSDQTDFIEIGHIANAPLNHTMKTKLENYIDNILHILGANFCPFHAEIRMNSLGEPVLMEIAARLAGDRIGDLINLSRNINYYDFVYASYLRTEFDAPTMEDNKAGIRFFYRPNIDQFDTLSGYEEAKQFPIEEISLYYPPEKPIPAFPKPLRRLGHVIIKNDKYLDLLSMLDDIDKIILFEKAS